MKRWISSWLLGSLAAGLMIAASPGSANAGTRAACGILTLAEVRGLVQSPVSVFQAGSSSPTTRGDSTFSTCVYVVMDASGRPTAGHRAATFSLMWAPAATLAKTSQFYTKRHKEVNGIKGGVLVLASITKDNNRGVDQSASQKLLAAVLQKL